MSSKATPFVVSIFANKAAISAANLYASYARFIPINGWIADFYARQIVDKMAHFFAKNAVLFTLPYNINGQNVTLSFTLGNDDKYLKHSGFIAHCCIFFLKHLTAISEGQTVESVLRKMGVEDRLCRNVHNNIWTTDVRYPNPIVVCNINVTKDHEL